MTPKRNAVRLLFSIEDAARIPGRESALTRDLRMALVEGVDRAVFLGDAGATGTDADIVGLNTAAVTENMVTQANKILGPGTLAAFTGLVDGVHAMTLADLKVIAAVGAWRLWEDTIINSTADNMTLAAFLRMAGLSWSARGLIETATDDGDIGAFVGRGMESTAPGSQRFLSTHATVYNTFNVQRHLISRKTLCQFRAVTAHGDVARRG